MESETHYLPPKYSKSQTVFLFTTKHFLGEQGRRGEENYNLPSCLYDDIHRNIIVILMIKTRRAESADNNASSQIDSSVYLSHHLHCLGNSKLLGSSLLCLRIEKRSKDCNGSSKGIDGLDRCMEDDDGGDYDRNPLHRVSYAKRQGRDLIQGHV